MLRRLLQRGIRPIDVIIVGVVGLAWEIFLSSGQELVVMVLFGLLIIDGIVALIQPTKK